MKTNPENDADEISGGADLPRPFADR